MEIKSYLLSVDNRGTGNSTALDCPAVQHFTQSTASPSFGRAVAACASRLNHRWRYANGTWVHASDLFTSALAARDLAGVMAALGLHRIDVYGDSYCSYFAQLFASLYPHLVRTLTLDSTYPVIASDPSYRSSIRDMPHDFNVVCSRSPACRAAAPGSSWSRLRELAGVLRTAGAGGRGLRHDLRLPRAEAPRVSCEHHGVVVAAVRGPATTLLSRERSRTMSAG